MGMMWEGGGCKVREEVCDGVLFVGCEEFSSRYGSAFGRRVAFVKGSVVWGKAVAAGGGSLDFRCGIVLMFRHWGWALWGEVCGGLLW